MISTDGPTERKQMGFRLNNLLSRKFVLAVIAVLLVTFGLDANTTVTAAVDGAVTVIFVLAQAFQNAYAPPKVD